MGNTLQQIAKTLRINNIEDAHVEARMLLGHILHRSPAGLYSEPEYSLNDEQKQGLEQLVERRLQREPSAYITNCREFYGINFYVDHRVLIPRPETELLVEEALKFAQPEKPLVIADIGTGCGNIAISLVLHMSNARMYAVDISASALEVAGINCILHKVTDRVILLQGNLLEPLTEPVDLIVANLPYIATPELMQLSPEIYCFEPPEALDGGTKGLNLINQLLRQVKEMGNRPTRLLLEIGTGQAQLVSNVVKKHLPNATSKFIPDLNGIERVIEITI